jgi:phospholipid-translocating ATPase
MERFFQILSLCHTVKVDNSLTEKYQASSPDEFSFVKFCSSIDIVYVGERRDTRRSGSNPIRTVRVRNKELFYEVLHILEFDSTRKRMSVILRDLQNDQVLLLSKGAESAIFKCCSSGDIQSCDSDIESFAQKGWRTLALAFKTLDEQEYRRIAKELSVAMGDLANRKEALANVYEDIETEMELKGATAIEDKLQEGVAETLEFLRAGGIKVWVLTGDKKETAINISINICLI